MVKNAMTSRERMMTALSGGIPDRVPCAPDISNMIPCKLTGKRFPEIYAHENPPLWRAYLDAIKYFGIDGWFDGSISIKSEYVPEIMTTIFKKGENEIIHSVVKTPFGDLVSENTCLPYDPPTFTQKYIKNFKEDFKKIKYLFPKITGYDLDFYNMQKKALGEDGMLSIGVYPAGFNNMFWLFNGGLEAITYAYYDEPDLFAEFADLLNKRALEVMDIVAEVKPDAVLTGGSGSITMQSESIWRELALPTIKEITKICKQNGIISGIHSCGKSEYIVKTCAEETDLNYINPLEVPPMGDCILKEIKQKYGSKLALMGNLHTTETMLYGSADLVRAKARQCIIDAGANGGFVLSSGDQCGRDTPFENIFAMLEVCKTVGIY